MQTIRYFSFKIIGVLVLFSLVLFYGCNSTDSDADKIEPIPPPPAIPTAANDGLAAVDYSIEGLTNFVTAGTGTSSNSVETISVDVPAEAVINHVFLYWARRGSETSPAPSSIKVNGTELMGEVLSGPVNMDEMKEDKAAISHRLDLSDLDLIKPGVNSFTVQDNPPEPAEALGASVIVFYSIEGQESALSVFEGVDFAWKPATASDPEVEKALQTSVPRTFTFDPADVEREAELTLLIGDITPNEAERPNSYKIEIGDSNTQQIGPSPNPFQGLQGARWDNYIAKFTIPAGVETVTVFPISGPGDKPASLVWILAGLSVPTP